MILKPTLVILAAGLGSRYGGMKQVDKVGPSGETILDYTIYDAIQVGFGKLIFVIKQEFENDFIEVFYKKWSDQVVIKFMYQSLENLPKGYRMPAERVKPWGTAHAVLMAQSEVDEPFAIVNADDFYGRESFNILYKQLGQFENDELSACMTGFRLRNTLSNNGSVSRGICQLDEDNNLIEIVEQTNIYKGKDSPYYLKSGEKVLLNDDQVVSMNLIGLSPLVFELIETEFKVFLDKNLTSGDLKAEFYIPSILDQLIKLEVNVPVAISSEKWVGVTYKEDKDTVVLELEKLTDNGTYPSPIWK